MNGETDPIIRAPSRVQHGDRSPGISIDGYPRGTKSEKLESDDQTGHRFGETKERIALIHEDFASDPTRGS